MLYQHLTIRMKVSSAMLLLPRLTHLQIIYPCYATPISSVNVLIMSWLYSCVQVSMYFDVLSVLWCCWLGLLTCKTHYRVREPTAAWQCVDIRQHRSFDNGRQYVSCGQRQPPLSGAPVNKMAVNYHEGEMDPSGFAVWWNSSSLWDIFVPLYRQCLTGSS